MLAMQRSENLLGQFHRDRGDRDRRGTHCGLRAHPLGDGKGAGQQQIQLRVDGAHRPRGRIGFLHLAQNLRFADHHGVQAGGHAKQVADGILLAVFVEVGIETATSSS